MPSGGASSSQGGQSKQGNGGAGPRINPPRPSAQAPTITSDEVEKQLMQNFQAFSQSLTSEEEESKTIGPEFFQVYKDLQNAKRGGEVFYHFLNKVFDRSEKEVEEVLPLYLDQLVLSKTLDQISFSKGVQKFLHMVPNIAADYPKLPDQLSGVMYLLFSKGVLSFKDIQWTEKKAINPDDEDAPMVEDYFRIVAHLLYKMSMRDQKWIPSQLHQFFTIDTTLSKVFSELKPLILEENLFNDIIESLGGNQKAKAVGALVEGDMDKFNEITN